MSEATGEGLPETPESNAPVSPVADGFLGRFLDLFRKPSRLMDNVGRHPRWWAPLLLIIFAVTAFSWLTMPIAAPEQVNNLQNSVFGRVLSEEDRAEMAESALDINPTKRIFQALADGFSALVFVVLFGLILGLFAQLSGGEVRFSQALGICIWGGVPVYVINVLVKLPIVFLTGSVLDWSIGLAALVQGQGSDSFLYKMLFNYGDFFTWWGLALIIIGFKRVFGMSLGPAILSVVLPWIVLTGIPVGIMLIMM